MATTLIFLIALLVALAVSFKIGAGFRFLERGLAIGSQLGAAGRHQAWLSPVK
ncbi:hypothetical protein ACFSUK_16700 [Sphingobium scionense]